MCIIASQPFIFESVSCIGRAQRNCLPLASWRTLTASINSLMFFGKASDAIIKCSTL